MSLNTIVIRDLLTAQEIKTIGENYFSKPVIVPTKNQTQAFRNMVYFSLANYSEKWGNPTITYVDAQPYDTADNMRDNLKACHELLISTQFNEPTKLMSKETNLLFRATHDLHHCSTASCNFELWGELCAFSKFAFDAYAYSESVKLSPVPFVSFLACEIIGQICALRLTGNFPVQRLSDCVPYGIIERILHAYR